MARRTVLVPLPPLDWGGLQTFAVNIQAGLAASGWSWTIIVPPEARLIAERLQDAGLDVVRQALPRLQRSPKASISAILALRGSIQAIAATPQARSADLVQAVGAHHPHGYMLSRALDKPLVWQLHSNILPRLGRKLVAPFIAAKADAIMTNGRSIGRAFWPSSGNGDHFVFYAPVNTDRFSPNLVERTRRREEIGVNDDEVLIGTVGNRGWQKNHELLLAAAGDLCNHSSKIRFLVLGAPVSSYEEKYRVGVLQVAEKINLLRPGAVQFLSPGATIDSWIHSLDVFVLTSHAEGVPIALFEAMAAAKPVVSSRVGSIDEIVVEGETGWTFAPGDKSALLRQLKALADSGELRIKMGASGRHRVLTSLSLDGVVAQHVAAYEYALKARGLPR